MTEQEKFEAWLFDYLVSKGMKTSDAKRMTTDAGKESIAFGAWQASRAAALEEAAKEQPPLQSLASSVPSHKPGEGWK